MKWILLVVVVLGTPDSNGTVSSGIQMHREPFKTERACRKAQDIVWDSLALNINWSILRDTERPVVFTSRDGREWTAHAECIKN